VTRSIAHFLCDSWASCLSFLFIYMQMTHRYGLCPPSSHWASDTHLHVIKCHSLVAFEQTLAEVVVVSSTAPAESSLADRLKVGRRHTEMSAWTIICRWPSSMTSEFWSWSYHLRSATSPLLFVSRWLSTVDDWLYQSLPTRHFGLFLNLFIDSSHVLFCDCFPV